MQFHSLVLLHVNVYVNQTENLQHFILMDKTVILLRVCVGMGFGV